MKPYYDDGQITIYHGDCREILPTLEPVDLVLTDPPYGVHVDYGAFQDTPENLKSLISETWPLIRASGAVVLATTGVKHLSYYPTPDWILCWYSPSNPGCGPWGFCTWQPIIAYGQDPHRRTQPDGFWHVAQPYKNGHPCPKPLAVIRWLVARGTVASDTTILDPFMGSGTTLRAAKDLGRKAIGIEIEEKYCEIAVKRLAQEVLPLGFT